MSAQDSHDVQAFPLPVAISPAGDEYIAYPGMSLRDWFAGQALVLVKVDRVNDRAPDIARAVYAVADAMLAARKGGAE